MEASFFLFGGSFFTYKVMDRHVKQENETNDQRNPCFRIDKHENQHDS